MRYIMKKHTMRDTYGMWDSEVGAAEEVKKRQEIGEIVRNILVREIEGQLCDNEW
jgi:hypothetical protein